MDNIETRVKSIMGSVLKRSPDTIGHDSSHETVENWDSLAHLNLVSALEQEFKISFRTDEILAMMSFDDICMTLKNKIGEV